MGAPMRLPLLLAMLLASIPGALLGTTRDDEVSIDFLSVDRGYVVHPFAFRVHNAALLQREGLCAREGCADERDLERERARMDVAVLCLVDNEMFQGFVLRSAVSVLPVAEGSVRYNQNIIKNMHFAEGSSDPVGFVDAHELAPGEYTIALKLVRSDTFAYQEATLDPATNKPDTTVLWDDAREQLVGVDSEVYSMRIHVSGGTSWALEGLMEATWTAALWSHAHKGRSAARDAHTSVRHESRAVGSAPDEVDAALGELPVMVFNLRHRPDKRKHMLALTAALGLRQVEIVCASSGLICLPYMSAFYVSLIAPGLRQVEFVEGISREEIDQHMDWLVEEGWVDRDVLDWLATMTRTHRCHLSHFVGQLQGVLQLLKSARCRACPIVNVLRH